MVRTLRFLSIYVFLALVSVLNSYASDEHFVAYWPMDEGSGTTVNDRSGTGNNGTIVGGATWVDGKSGKALSFDGTNTYVDCGNNESLSIDEAITIETWFYPRAYVTGYAKYPFSKWTTTSDGNYVMYFFGNSAGTNYKKVQFYGKAGGTWHGISPAYEISALNTWYHIVCTYSSTDGGKLYVNGILYASTPAFGTLTVNNANLKIGGADFNGMLDEVSIYSRVLSQEEIVCRYRQNVGKWSFSEGSGQTTINSASSTDYGQLLHMDTSSCWVDGKVGKALSFDGLDDYVNCGNGPRLNITGVITVEIWFYPKAWVSGYTSRLIKKWTNANDANYVLYFFGDTAGGSYKTIQFYGNAGGTWQALSPAYMVETLKTWYHIAWTYTGNQGGKLYVNGELQGTVAVGAGLLATNNAGLYLGGVGFDGALKNFKIYNRVLSEQEIRDQRIEVEALKVTEWQNTIATLRSRKQAIPDSSDASVYWKGRVEQELQAIEASQYTIPLCEYNKSPYTTDLILAWLSDILTGLENGEILTDKFLTYSIGAPVTCLWILPYDTCVTIPGEVSNEISLKACPGEYEPASFVVSASDVGDIASLQIEVSDLTQGTETIPAGSVDIKAVKCWYQAGTAGVSSIQDKSKRVLVPELLLNNDDLVRADYETKDNYLRLSPTDERWISDPTDTSDVPIPQPTVTEFSVQDSSILQPVNIPANSNKQFWVTVKIPDTAVAGLYSGVISFKLASQIVEEVVLKVEVLPFILQPPYYTSSIYYRGRLVAPTAEGTISSEGKSITQFSNELENMFTHGVTNPTLYQLYDTTVYQEYGTTLLEKALQIRNEKGMGNQPLYYIGLTTGNPTSQDALDALKNKVSDVVSLAGSYGIPEVYIYGIDEAKGDTLASERAAWNAVHEAGGKVFVAGYQGENYELMGDIQDLLICYGVPSVDEAAEWHSVGHKIWCYANPQGGVEDPNKYRRNYGLLLWKSNYDGACTFAYHSSYSGIWNDFDSTRYRDQNFTYPTIDGVIDTIAWEGYREGVDDLRYLATLQAAITRGKALGDPDAYTAEAYLNNLNVETGDLNAIRTQMIEYITCLP